MLKRYDTASASWVDADSVKRFDTATNSWVEAESAKAYDAATASWIEKWRAYRYITLQAFSANSGSSYNIRDNGKELYVAVRGDSEDYFNFFALDLNIPNAQKFSFTFAPDYWDCLVQYQVRSGNVVIATGFLSKDNAGVVERTLGGNYTVTQVQFTFSRPTSPVAVACGASISNVVCDNIRFKFTGN